ncbi:dehydration-responsive element-binding protein 1A-like [Panicum virgatum]|uniref:dehydration-responsive element-binding protein 1A-like n=1 Tax=Panicum virgatum TaxID=38727 RepID=UPI0019D568DF|nr:dehydration-responsive element-binding protein 1A-like [Panicum virgatum]
MCQIKQEPSSCESVSSSVASTSTPSPAATPNKRPAGRTKFRETRHPVFRGVRRSGRAGGRCRWVCEVRVPGRRGCRLWLGTYGAAEAAARAHDAAARRLNDDDASSAKSDDVTASPFELDDVLSDMGAGLYYASMAQGLLMDPPASDASCCDDVDCDDAAVPLWAY